MQICPCSVPDFWSAMPEVADSAQPDQRQRQLADNDQRDVDKGTAPWARGRPLDNGGMQEREGETDGQWAGRQGGGGGVTGAELMN